jgi:L-lactate permease
MTVFGSLVVELAFDGCLAVSLCIEMNTFGVVFG